MARTLIRAHLVRLSANILTGACCAALVVSGCGSNPSEQPTDTPTSGSTTSGTSSSTLGSPTASSTTTATSGSATDSSGSPSTSTSTSGSPTSNPTGGPASDTQGSSASTTTGTPSATEQTSTPPGSSDTDVAPDDTSPLDYPEPVEAADEDGSKLWLRYPLVPVQPRLEEYKSAFLNVVNTGTSETLIAAADELTLGLSGLTGNTIEAAAAKGPGDVVIGIIGTPAIDALGLNDRVTPLGPEGYLVERVQSGSGLVTVVAANSDIGVLYGSFALLRHLSMHGTIATLSLSATPKIQHRILNHWDDLDGAIERGYAGRSLWNWTELPGTLSPRYKAYARANASVGINGAVLTNVNATKGNNEAMWGADRASYLQKVKALADVFRPYGIRVYLTAPFNAGGTANPNDANTRQWWVDALNDVYAEIPDFGGLLIKASSEGEPGPSNGATHADGANMLAEAVGERGLVMWRAFVYSENAASDRIRQAHDEFKPLDGQFADNVFVQVKNGPLDFQPREPVSPLFGDMPETQLALELQITKEYLGEDTHLAYLGAMYEEILKTDTYADGAGSTVARVLDGTVHGSTKTAIAGVSNIGSDTNWTGSHFNQANWYAFGRLAWDPDASARTLAQEWIRQTLSNDPDLVEPVADLMMASHQTLVDYMTPLGLAHIMGTDHHYGPMPWENSLSRAEWNPVYYHNADNQGIGFDRTMSGSNAIEQYHDPKKTALASVDTVGADFLLFFHHVGWDTTLDTGRTVWEELVHRYSVGVDGVQVMRDQFALAAEGRIDEKRFSEMTEFLQVQHWEARWWRDACLSYFANVSGHSVPEGYAAPLHDLAFYQGLNCPTNAAKPRCQQVYDVEASPAVLP
jgi:alpha-glucuronidase